MPPNQTKPILSKASSLSTANGGKGRGRRWNSNMGYMIFVVPMIMALVYLNLKQSFGLVDDSDHKSNAPMDGLLSIPHIMHGKISSSSLSETLKRTGEFKTIDNGNLDLHIYWLKSNSKSDQAQNQRIRMEEAFRKIQVQNASIAQFNGMVTEIPWWTLAEVKRLWLSSLSENETKTQLNLKNNITLVEPTGKVFHVKRPRQYTLQEAACVFTHLTAIAIAHQHGHERVLFLQNDAILTQDFMDHYQNYSSLAPKDWTVLQWSTSNLASMEQTWHVPEPWISWLPDLWNVGAYTMTKEGISAVVRRLIKFSTKGIPTSPHQDIVFTFDEDFKARFLADEILFSVPDQKAYTSTFPWIITDDIQKSIDLSTPFGAPFKNVPPSLPIPEYWNQPTRNESILVFMNVRFATSKRMADELNRTILDLETLCKVHRHTKCHWVIQSVFTQKFLLERFQKKYEKTLPSNIIDFRTTVSEDRFNKFGFLKEYLTNMSNYDLVLIKDNDQRIAGFPWASFLEKKGRAIVSGPLRQAPGESFLKSKIWELSQHYKFHDARGWKMSNFAPWSTPMFIDANPIEVHFLEMYFNVFDGEFAQWFFSQLLFDEFINQTSCWGPDFLWCSAAKQFALRQNQTERTGCVIVPYVSVHEDTRQIWKDGEAFNERGYATVDMIRNRSKAFGRWYDESNKYARGLIAWRQLDAIAKHCRLKLMRGAYKDMEQIEFSACVDAAMARTRIV